MFLPLRTILYGCLLPVLTVTSPSHIMPAKPGIERRLSSAEVKTIQVIKVTFLPDRRPENPNSDSLFYHASRKLRWSDFKAIPPMRGKSGAVSYTSFAYEGNSLHKKDTLLLNLTLQVFFIKSASWSKPIVMDATGLTHEQLHFDITWLVALRFQQRIKTMPLTIEDYDSIIQYQYLEFFREMNHLQDAYDDETSHGQNPAAQVKWQRAIAEAIATLTIEGAITGPIPFTCI